MTMIVALANDQHVIQISDRRLSCDGELVDDEVNKATFLECDDVCAIIGFTGLARYKRFDVQEWLLETLNKCPHTNFLDICDYIASEGTALFNTHHVLKYTSKAVKKLTFMLTGFRNDGLIVNAIISNYQCTKTLTDSAECFDEFRVLPLINSVDNSKSSAYRSMGRISKRRRNLSSYNVSREKRPQSDRGQNCRDYP
ncbi:hypothetical protein [Vibrio crassostreae]|uniref:hypothetical protein n=1 Tax=Vibrio crassostreae TaxID=246167 RepID=UPI001B310D7E|nr:hypothetical protein [Vibrio crassostreae]